MLLVECESPKKATREESDEAGKEGTWSADIGENADECLRKEDQYSGFKLLGPRLSGLTSNAHARPNPSAWGVVI